MSVLFSKVLIALPQDDREAAELASLGLAVAQTHHAQTRLLSVLRADVPVTPTGVGLAAFDVVTPKPATLTRAAVKKREAMVSSISEKHIERDKTSQSIRVGNPSQIIMEEADEWGADLIIVGARDKSWLERIFETSVSQTVAKRADCAVLILPEKERAKQGA